MSTIREGSCLCGKIKIETSGDPLKFSYCHCKMCQKFSGGPFGAFVRFYQKDLTYTKGEEFRKEIDSSDWAKRAFCSECGTSLEFIYKDNPEHIAISAGLFDTEIGMDPQTHIFVKDKCSYYEITDEIKQIERF